MNARTQIPAKAALPPAFTPMQTGLLQRTCACGGIPGLTGECAECSKNKLQRASLSSRGREPVLSLSKETESEATVPPIVHETLRSSGQPLDAETRSFMESRFGRDFSQVRVHADAKAAESARAVNALAYTVGRDLVFGAGQYTPQAAMGRRLLTHELAHVVQQSAIAADNGRPLRLSDPSASSEQEADAAAQALTRRPSTIALSALTGSPRMLQRACISDPECKPATPGALPGTAVKGSATHFVTEVERAEQKRAEEEKRKTPREIRQELCNKQPPDPRCTSDGHGRRASAFEDLFRPSAPTQLSLAKGVFVDKDIPKEFGAYVWGCSNFVPRLEGITEGDLCIFLPERLENEAVLYQKEEKTIAGRDREEWLTQTLGTITHEVEHVRFGKEFPQTELGPGACKFADVSRELSEFAAIMSEFPVFYRAYANKPWYERRAVLSNWFRYKNTQPQKHGETLAGILKAIRCRCECSDVDAYIKKTVEFTTESWTEDEKNTFHMHLRDPEWKLDWPIETPLPPRDIPSLLVTPSLQLGYSYLGSFGVSAGLGLDVGVPLDRLGKWQLLLGAQGRFISGLGVEEQTAYLYGLKVGFLRGPALGASGLQFGAFGELGRGDFTSSPLQGPKKEESGTYAGGGVSFGYNLGLSGRFIPSFIGVEVAGGTRLDMTKPEVQKWFVAGISFKFPL